MATSVRLLRRYVWLIDTIRRAGRITLEEINRKWMDERTLRLESEVEIPERTFHRHRQAIADIFGIDILCNRFDGNTYYIDNDEALSRPSFTSWLFNGLAIDNRLMGNRGIADKVIFEDTPGGGEFLPIIIEALTESRVLSLTYLRFNSVDVAEHRVQPYGLKQSGRRWYLLGVIAGGAKPVVFSLDRIELVTITDESFVPDKNIDIQSYFDEVIGVNVDDDYDCEKVRLRVFGRQRAYVEALPLHKSQHLVERTKEYTEYEFTLRPEYEFQHAILALGSSAEVISPHWLRDEMKWLGEEIVKRYQ